MVSNDFETKPNKVCRPVKRVIRQQNFSVYTKINQGIILQVPVNLCVDHELKTQVKNKQRIEVGPRFKKKIK